MADVVLQGVWLLHRINKDEGDECLPLRDFRRDVINAIFLKYSKEGRLCSSDVGIRNIPSDVCYNDLKNYQVQSEKAGVRCAKRTLLRHQVKCKST